MELSKTFMQHFGLPCPLVAADDGYNQINMAFWSDVDGELSIVENKIASRGKRGRALTTFVGEGAGLYATEDEVYTISGNLSEPEDTRSDDYPKNPLNRFLVHAALNHIGLTDSTPVALVTGLPLKQYNGGVTGVNQALIDAKRDNLLKPVTVGVQQAPSANIVYHGCYAEAIGGMIDYLLDINSKGEIVEREGVLPGVVRMALDIGGNTTDMAIINPDSTVEHMDTIKYGVSHIRDRLKTLLEDRFSMSVDSLVVDEALDKKQVLLLGENHIVEDLWNAAVHEVLSSIFYAVEAFRRKSPSLREIIAFGGGVALCEEVIRERFRQVVVLENPDGANARGFLKAATFLDRETIVDGAKSNLPLTMHHDDIGAVESV